MLQLTRRWWPHLIAILGATVAVVMCVQHNRHQYGDSAPILDLEVGKDGRPLIIPVELADGRVVQFLVDTGAALTIFDVSLRDGTEVPVGQTTLKTSASAVPAKLFNCPSARIGQLPLNLVPTITYMDLAPIRQATGHEIRGIVGMDFLRHYAVELDFDEGRLRLWNDAPKAWSREGERIPLVESQGRLGIELSIGSRHRELFVLDSGANVSTVREELFDILEREGILSEGASQTAVTGTGVVRDLTGYVSHVEAGSLQLNQVRMDRDPYSVLGLRHLSRFVVRLDPKNCQCNIEAGARFSLPEPTATSGMGVIVLDGQKVVCSVQPSGPAEEAGIAAGDVLLTVNGQLAADSDVFELSQIMTRQPGKTVQLELRRGHETFATAVVTRSQIGVAGRQSTSSLPYNNWRR